jgi:phage recombination protein Bet
MAVNGGMALQTSAVDPVVAEAMQLRDRIDAVRSVLAPDLTDAELQLFAMVAQRTGLDPFARHIYAIKRGGRMTIQTGIDGFRSVAESSGEYRGSDEPVFGPIIAAPFPHPEWALVVVHREKANGSWIHQPKKVFWDEFYPGPNQGMWGKMPKNQLAKCAEAGALRMAFPQHLGQVYVSEEMDQADAAEAAVPVTPITHRDQIAAERARLEARSTSVPVSADEGGAGQGIQEPAAADPSPVPPKGAGEGDASVLEGQAVEVLAGTPLNPGELRDWLRGELIGITEARDVAKAMYGIDALDRLTDSQRGTLRAEFERRRR